MEEERANPANPPQSELELQGRGNTTGPTGSGAGYSLPSATYPIEDLEVHEQIGSAPQVIVGDQLNSSSKRVFKNITFSKRKAVVVSTVITLLIMALTGSSILLGVKRAPKSAQQKQTSVEQQDVTLKDADAGNVPLELQGGEKALFVNGDIVTRGSLKVSNGSFVTIIKSSSITADQTLTLPNTSGALCLDSNNCNYADQARVTQLATQLGQLSQQIGRIDVTAGVVTAVNNQVGSITIQGSLNQISVASNGGVLTLSTPQNLDANANVQFGNLTLGTSGSIRTNSIQQTVAGNDVAISAGSDSLVFTAGGRTFTFPTSGAASQTICTTGASCASGGGMAVLLAPGSAQTDTTSDDSIFINDTGGGQLLRLQSVGVDVLTVDNNGDTTVGGTLTVASLTNGFVRATSGALSVVSSIDLASSDVSNTLPVNRGGTGASSLTANGVVIGNGTSPVSSVTSAGAGLCLVSNVGAPSFQTCPGSTNVSSLNSLTGAITLQGTTNRVSVSTGSGVITLSTPQDINTTSSPTFAALTLSGLTTGVVRVSGGTLTTGTVSLTSEVNGTLPIANGGTGTGSTPTNGQLLIGNGTNYTLATLTQGAGIAITNGSGSITIASSFGSTIDLGTSETNGNYVATISGGNGVNVTGGSGAGSTPSVTLTLQANKGLEVDGSGLSLIDCATNGFILKYTTGTSSWGCAADDTGTYTLAGSAGTPQTITSGDTLTVEAGTNITTTAAAGDKVTVATVANPNFATSVTTPLLQSTGTLTITPGGALTIGAATQLATLQGSTTTITSSAGNNIVLTRGAGGQIQLTGFDCSGNTNSGKLTTDASGNISCGNDIGPAANTITGPGTLNRLAYFTGAQTIGDSWLLQNGATLQLDNNINLSITGTGALIIGGDTITDLVGTGLQLSTGVLQTTLGTTVDLTSETSGNYVATIAGSSQVSVTGSGSSNAAVTLGLVADSVGDTQLAFNTGQHLTTTSTPTFSTLTLSSTLAVQGASATIGTSGQAGSLILSDGSSNTATIQTSALSVDRTFLLPDVGTSATICVTSGGSSNCVGTSGGAIGGSGTAGTIPKFSGSGFTIADSTLSELSGTLTATGNLIVQGSNSLTLGTSSALDGSITFRNANGSHTVALQAPATDPASNLTFVLPASYGANGDCLQSNGSGGLTFTSCTGGAGGGVTSIDGQTGVVDIANASGASGTITINDASTAAKGIAQFNSTNFNVSAGIVNTIQDIANTASPTFAGLTLSNFSTAGVVHNNASGALSTGLVALGSEVSGTLGVTRGGTGLGAGPTADGQLIIGAAGGTYALSTLTAGAGVTITNGTNSIIVAAPTAGTCTSGCADQSLSNLSGVAINASLLPGTAGAISLGSSLKPFQDLYLAGGSGTPGTNNFRFTGTSTGGTRVLTLPDLTGTLALVQTSGSSSAQTGEINVAGNVIANRLVSVLLGSADSTSTSNVTLRSGNASSGNSGNVGIDTGTATGTNGTITIGGTNASALTLGRSGLQVQIPGGLTTNGATIATANGSINAGTGTISSGAINGQTLGTTSSFTGTLSIAGANALTLGQASTNTGAIIFQNNSGSNTVTLKASNTNPGSSITFTLPAALPGGIECLNLSSGGQIGTQSCSSGLGGSGTAGTIPIFDGTGNSVADSLITQSGSVVSILGTTNSLSVNGSITTGLNGASGGIGSLILNDGTNPGRAVTVQPQTVGSSYTLQLPTSADVGSTCLVLSNVSAGVNKITGGSCAAGGSGGNVNATADTNNHLLRTTNSTTHDVTASLIQDDGTTVGVNTSPQTDLFTVGSSNAFRVTDAGAISASASIASSGLIQTSANNQALTLSGTPTNTATQSLVQLGSAIASGNNAANGGTYIGINNSGSGAGSAADFLNFQTGGTYKLKVSSAGLLDAVGGYAIGGTSVISSGRAAQNLTGITSSGSITFSGLSTNGIVTVSGGVLSSTTTVSPANGGTGLGAPSTDGAILIGKADGTYSSNRLTAGTGVTIDDTSSPGSITISAAGAGTCTGCADRQLSNLTGTVAIPVDLLGATAGTINIGSSSVPFRNLYLSGTSTSPGSNNFTITGVATGARTITLPDASGTVCVKDTGVNNCSFVSGTGTTNYVAKFTAAGAIGNTLIFDDGTNVGIGDNTPTALLTVGPGDLFQVNNAGAIAAATGISTTGNIAQSGTGTFGTGSGNVSLNGAVTAASTVAVNGNTTLGDASGDTITINGTTVSIPNNLNIDSNTLFVDSTNDRVGFGTNSANTTVDINGAVTIRSTSAPSNAPTDQGRIYYDATSDTLKLSLNGGGYTDICTTTTCAGSSGSGNYIQNGTGVQTNANFAIQSNSSSSIVGLLRGAASQTADILQAQDSNGSVLARITANGDISAVGNIANAYGGFGTYSNLLSSSQDFSNGSWTASNLTVTANDGTSNPAPNSTTTADKLVSSAGNATITQSYTTTTNGNYTFSVWIKTNSGTQPVQLRIDSTGATPTTGTASSFTASTAWQRVYVTQSFTGTPSNIKPTIVVVNNGATVVVWGAQLVTGTSPQIYTVGQQALAAGTVVNGGKLTLSDEYEKSGSIALTSGGTGNGYLDFIAGGTSNIVAQFSDSSNALIRIGATGSPTGFREGIATGGRLLVGNSGSLFSGQTADADLSFARGADRVIDVLQAASGAGSDLTIQAGQGAAGNNIGGDLILNAGAKTGSGLNGNIEIGRTNTNIIYVGGSSTGQVMLESNALTSVLGAQLYVNTSSVNIQPNTNAVNSFKVQDVSNNVVLSVDTANQRVGIGNAAPGNLLGVGTLTTADNLATAAIAIAASGNKGLIIQEASGQTQNPLEVQSNNGSVVANITANGSFTTVSSINITSTYTTASSNRISVGGTLNSSVTTNQYGIQNSLNFNPSGASLSNIYGSSNVPTISGSGLTIATVRAVTGRIDTAAGFSGSVTNGYVFQAFDAALAGGGITNQIGFAVDALTAGTNNVGIRIGEAVSTGNDTNLLIGTTTVPSGDFSIYNSSTDSNYFAGSLGIGTTGANTALDLQGGFTIRSATAPSSAPTDQGRFYYDATSDTVKLSLNGAGYSDICTVSTCTGSGAGATLQQAYNADPDGSDVTISLTSTDGSIILSNPGSSGSTSAFVFKTENLATGSIVADFKNNWINAAGSFNTTSGALTNYGLYVDNTSTRSSGSNTLTNVGLYVNASGAQTNYAALFQGGNVGVGISTPASLLHISAGTNGDAGLTLQADTDNNGSGDNPYIELLQDGATPGGAGGVKGIVALVGSAGFAPGVTSTSYTDALADGLLLGTKSSGALQLGTDNAVRLTVSATGNVGIGTATPNGKLTVDGSASATAWGLNGIQLQVVAATYTDSSTSASGTAINAAINSIGQSTLAATNLTVTTTNSSSLYIAGAPISGTNQTLTNTYGLRIASTATVDGAGGTPTNAYGLYVDAPTGATNNYAGYFSGKVAINNVLLGSNVLDAYTGNAGVVAAFQSNGATNGDKLVVAKTGNTPVTGIVYGFHASVYSTNRAAITVQQNDNGTAELESLVLGSGDAIARFNINGGQNWTLGLDNSDSDSFKIAGSNILGSSDYFTITTGGNVGIGNAAPGSLLVVGSSSQFAVASTGATTIQASTDVASLVVKQSGSASTGDIFNVQTSNGNNFILVKSTALNQGTVLVQSRGAGNALTLQSSDVTANSVTSGDVNLVSGNSSGTSGNSGSINIQSGTNGSGGSKGYVTLQGNGGNVGIGTSTPSTILALGNGADRTIKLENQTAGNTAGNNLILQGANAFATTTGGSGGGISLLAGNAAGSGNNAGGTITLTPGLNTGTGNPGSVLVKSPTSGNYTYGFQVQNAAGQVVFNVNTNNSRVGIGDPELNDTNSGRLGIYQAPTTGGGTSRNMRNHVDNSGVSSANTIILQELLIEDSSNFATTLNGLTETITATTGSGKTVNALTIDTTGVTAPGASVSTALFKAANSTTAFVVQDSSANVIFDVNSTNRRIGINTNAPSASLHLVAPDQTTATSNAEQVLQVTGGQGGSAGATQTGGTGSVIVMTGGKGGNATATNGTPGNGGAITLSGGDAGNLINAGTLKGTGGDVTIKAGGGGTGTGTSINGDGGNVILQGGAKGTGGSGTAGATGSVIVRPQSGNDGIAFIIQTASPAALFAANTSSKLITIGSGGTPDISSGGTGSLYVTNSLEVDGRLLIGSTSNGVDTNSGKITYTGTYRQDRLVTLRPEYDGMTLSATGPANTTTGANTGILTSDFCSNEGSLTTNNTKCNTGEDHSYYEWTHSETTDQDYYIYVRYRMPNDFDSAGTFSSDVTVRGYASKSASSSDNNATIALYNNVGAQCGSTTDVTNGTINQWGSGTLLASTSGDTDCDNIDAGEYVTFVIHLTANSTGSTGEIIRMGEIEIAYKSTF